MKSDKAFKILIVEDENIIAENLKSILKDHGYQVVGIANSGSQAIALHKAQDPDLVIIDIILADSMNGMEAAAKMQEFKPIPVIFLTVLEYEVIMKNVQQLRSFRHILKPYKENELINSITVLLENDKQVQAETSYREIMTETLDQISDGIIILGKQGNIIFSNLAIKRIFGLGKDDQIDETLFYFSDVAGESEIEVEVADHSTPCLVRSIELDWGGDKSRMLVIKDLTSERKNQARIEKLKQLNSALEKKFGIGYFRIEFSEKPRMLDANSAFVKKMQFKQYSDLRTKTFTDLLSKHKDYLLIYKKLSHEPVITNHKLDFVDQQGNLVKAEINAELVKKEKGPDQIKGRVFFLD